MPALTKAASRPPSAVRASSTARCTPASSAASQAVPPAAPSSESAASTVSCRLPITHTCAPSSSRRRAAASPSPLGAPGIDRRRRAPGARERAESRLPGVVRVAAALVQVQVHRAAAALAEALEERDQVDAEHVLDALEAGGAAALDDAVRATLEGDLRQSAGLVHDAVREAAGLDTLRDAIANDPGRGGPERQADVLADHVREAERPDLEARVERHVGIPAEHLQHVVEEGDAGVELGRADRPEVDGGRDERLARFAPRQVAVAFMVHGHAVERGHSCSLCSVRAARTSAIVAGAPIEMRVHASSPRSAPSRTAMPRAARRSWSRSGCGTRAVTKFAWLSKRSKPRASRWACSRVRSRTTSSMP